LFKSPDVPLQDELLCWSFVCDIWPTWIASIDRFSMLPQLHAVKVLFYTESVGVVTSGHVTKMAVTPCDPPCPKTPGYTRTPPLYLL